MTTATGAPPIADLDREFAQTVGAQFEMTWRFHPAQPKCRAVLAVSKHGHCLNSMLHRWSTGTLPIEVVAVVSNHQDLRSLTEWHGIPFHYFPALDGRKAEQEQRIVELFEKVDGELLVLARYMQDPERRWPARTSPAGRSTFITRSCRASKARRHITRRTRAA